MKFSVIIFMIHCPTVKSLEFVLACFSWTEMGSHKSWACHMLTLCPSLVRYLSMQFSDSHAGHIKNWARTQEPRRPTSHHPPCSDSPGSHLRLPDEHATSCRNSFIQTLSGVETMGSSCTDA